MEENKGIIVAGSILGALIGGIPGALIGGLIGSVVQEFLCPLCGAVMQNLGNGHWKCSRCNYTIYK